MIQNVKKILAPIDFSEQLDGSDALGAGAGASDVNAEVHIVHVWRRITRLSRAASTRDSRARPRCSSRRKKNSLRIKKDDFGNSTKIVTAVLTARRWSSCASMREENQIDLIMMATHGRTGAEFLTIGGSRPRKWRATRRARFSCSARRSANACDNRIQHSWMAVDGFSRDRKNARWHFSRASRSRIRKIFDSLLTDDFEFEMMGGCRASTPIRGKEAFLKSMPATLKAMFPKGLNMKFNTVIAEGPHVAIQAESDTIAGNGKKYANRYHFIFVFKGDRIAQVREYNDTNHVREVFMS